MRRFHLNKKRYIVIVLILIVGCATPPDPDIDFISVPDLSTKDYCRGNGYILSKGTFDGRLNFMFSSSRDTAYIQFRDIIGRKILFLVVSNNEIDAWDMRNNRRYNKESILLTLPIFELIEPSQLRTFLWGSIPSIFSDANKIKSESDAIHREIQFKSVQTQFGALVNNISFRINDKNSQISLEITEREFDEQYPHLIREIPNSIILINESS
ncbi:MAG: hypothetical protein CMF81_05685 [Candidatus Marinimicrobia bacterium]|nr:hypothetical protein [Candidatus Neomarinimicrobiota bacterium]